MVTLVTGGAGFIGSHIVDGLLGQGHEVRVFDNLASGNLANISARQDIQFIEGDIRNLDALGRAMRGVEVVFHQAAIPSVPQSVASPLLNHEVNITGTFNALLAARDSGVRRLVFASSSSVYGETGAAANREDMAPAPLSPYAAAKLMGEYYCRLFYMHYDLETVALRYFNVFGPRQNPRSEYAAVIPRFIAAVLTGEQPTIYGDGEQTRDFVYVQNVVDGNLAAASSVTAPGNVYNLACGERISLNQLLEQIGGVTGRDVRAHYEPARTGDIRDSVADVSAARRDLGYKPRVSLAEGLASLAAAAQSTV